MNSFLWLSIAGLLVLNAHSRLNAAAPAEKAYDFPIYKNNPPGRQLTGQHAPANTSALSPDAAQRKFALPPGFEIRLFAAEPEIVNPVAMTWDERGRLWVVELYEYPLGAKPDAKARDRIKILEDADADGQTDKVTVFADGLNLATGILLGNSGVYVGQAPHFLFMRDTDGDDKADTQEILKTGFGLEDRHELLNGFAWGPDGHLYMTHGVFTHSKVVDPGAQNTDPVVLTAGVARFHPATKKFEVFAEGTSNPWGVDFDRHGNAFVSACVIEHLFHLAPGGIYDRQAGQPPHPYAYELLHAINDHKHHMAAYAGIQVYQGDQFSAENAGTILQGNIHDNAVHQDKLTATGSSFTASKWRDLVRANDGWFMPVSTQVGPDGAVWIMDWYDRYPCYQNANADPAGVDREHGRIWRVVHVGDDRGKVVPSRPQRDMNLAKLSSVELVGLLAHKNSWHRRTAQRLLSERAEYVGKRLRPEADGKVELALIGMLSDVAGPAETRLAAFWTLFTSGLLSDTTLDKAVADREPAIRMWAARFIGERGDPSDKAMERLATLARDTDPTVRSAVASAARMFTSGSLTVNTSIPEARKGSNVGSVLEALLLASKDTRDPVIPFTLWLAAEPLLAQAPEDSLNWFAENGLANMPLAGRLLTKAMRRFCDTQNPKYLDYVLDFLAKLPTDSAPLAIAALDGLIEGQRGKALTPSKPTAALVNKLLAHSNNDVVSRARQLGTLWGDAAALQQSLTTLQNLQAATDQRVQAIQALKQQKIDPVRQALLKLLVPRTPDRLIEEAVRALSDVGGDGVGEEMLKSWPALSPSSRRVVAEALASRRRWALPFLSAVEKGEISASEVPVPVRRNLTQSRDDYVRNRAGQALGRYRETGADKLKLIAEKRKVVLSGPVDLRAGHEVAIRACLNCHKLHGEGAEVGPDLTGVGRSTLDALLANVIDPNQVIGKGYENVEIDTKDGRSLSGRMVENTDARIKLLAAGPKEEIVAKSDIASTRVSELSVMPEGLEQMPDEDFRNMIWYILNPPQDNRPLTPELRRQLVGEEKPSASVNPPSDAESIALWNPEWKVICPDFEDAPRKLPEFAGRRNVLMTHPVDAHTGAALERVLDLAVDSKPALAFAVAAHEHGDWELRVLADGKLLHRRLVGHTGERWKHVSVDLSDFAGKTLTLRLENCANDWKYEFGYWSDLRVETDTAKVAGEFGR